MSVVDMKGRPAGPTDQSIAVAEMCERVAADARAGRVSSAAIAFVGSDGAIKSLWETQGHVPATIGAVAVMLAEMTGARPVE